MPPPDLFNASAHRDVFSVSRLNREVRSVLQNSFPLLWVTGEISNLAQPSSGHFYFSLKDEYAQVRCALFRTQRQRLRFKPENGMQVLMRARVGLYESRGEFQLVAEHMELAGEGALRVAFEQLKQKLAAESLFDSDHKKPLPSFPSRLGLITSPSGAAIRDILSVLRRRFPGLEVIVYPAQVQGEDAATQLASALKLANQRAECDVLILTRGGGSLEDLMPFNDESLARAIYHSTLPVVVGVGHEIDFSIADFVADQRAATPSAAAELISPDLEDLLLRLRTLKQRAARSIEQHRHRWKARLDSLSLRLTRQHPGQRLLQQQQGLDELEQRMIQATQMQLQSAHAHLLRLQTQLHSRTPVHRLETLGLIIRNHNRRLIQGIGIRLDRRRQRLTKAAHSLDTVSPLATLQRGYSITLGLPERNVLRVAAQVDEGDQVETRLHRGRLLCRVEKRYPED